MIVEYVYGKPKDYVDLGTNAEKVDISIMNFFEGSKEKTIDINEQEE